MSPKCPNCGWSPPKGRPREIDEKKVRRLRKKGLGIREIARELGVSHGAIRKVLARAQTDRQETK